MRKAIGDVIPKTVWTNIDEGSVLVPQQDTFIHLQFRRFAGCPVCNLHLQSFFKRAEELKANNIHEVVVFHASQKDMLASVVDVPFDLIADPSRKLYKEFGVETSWKALLNLGVMQKALKGIRKFGMKIPQSVEAELGVPADFLINQAGTVVALKYGAHADDQWSVDEVIELAKSV
jgi:peroxiredoxin